MSTKPKLISDIRFYENSGRTEYGNFCHGLLGKLYQIPFRSFDSIGDRLACKLREYEFTLQGFDHIYVILTPSLPLGVVEPSLLAVDSGVRYVDAGVPLEHWDSLTDDSKHDQLVDLTCDAIGAFAHDANKLSDAVALIKQYRSQLEIVLKSKETSSYRVELSFQIRPLQGASAVFISYTDKQSKQHGCTLLTKLLSANDVYSLCGSIAVRDSTIKIKPRSSACAAAIIQKYDVPLSITVDAVLGAEGTKHVD